MKIRLIPMSRSNPSFTAATSLLHLFHLSRIEQLRVKIKRPIIQFFLIEVDSKDYWRVNEIDVNEYARVMLKKELGKHGILFQNKDFKGKEELLFELKPEEDLADFYLSN